MSDASGLKKWLKCGCFGCLGLVALIVLSVVVLSAIAKLRIGHEKLETEERAHEVPPRAGGEAAPGQVVLRVSQAGFHVEPAEPGEPIHVRARYDKSSYELIEEFRDEGGSAWTYRVEFRGRGSSFMHGLTEWLGGTRPEVRVFLPPDVPLTLDLEVGQGGAECELGGLWLTTAEIDVQQGGLKLAFDRPLHEPMQSLSIRTAMGGAELTAIGNASPRKLDFDTSMGGIEADLTGRWVTDASVSIKSRMGGVEIRLPDDVRVVGVDTGRLATGQEPERALPTLTFAVDADMGGVEFVDR